MLFNFHTHNIKEPFGIINIYPTENLPSKGIFSCGLHPWHYSKDYCSELEIIKHRACENKIIAIGETGLDPKSPIKLSEQLTILKKHIEISEFYQLPLIIHCVKYHNELIRIKKQIVPKQSWIIHGYNSKTTTLQQLIDAGFCISINSNLLQNVQKAEEVLKIAGLDKVFIETDDSDEDISINYKFVANYFGYPIDKINNQIINNLKRIGLNVA
ncbi:MAG: TatD family hydrolase [Bacteroidales bacterium]|nr:TatD family hydrolase [Bacteroidales bacterium]MDD4218194.1 TatD family hydrolase [Bacteroidales bacterium]MDY0141421.1 TatD family hydrolase [Bacteroidales bacterium]